MTRDTRAWDHKCGYQEGITRFHGFVMGQCEFTLGPPISSKFTVLTLLIDCESGFYFCQIRKKDK